MSNYFEYKGSIAFHPGYYIEELVEESGLTQQDFANRLDTTPKNLSKLINGQQSLSVEMAMKLSRMLGTSLEYWLNLQDAYDAALAKKASDEQLEQEIVVLKKLGYDYFRDKFHLADLPRKLGAQVVEVRSFLRVASLTVLAKRDLAVSFRSAEATLSDDAVLKANALVQIAVNQALAQEAPKFDKDCFAGALDFALTQTSNHADFHSLVKDAFLKAGVILVVLPNLEGSRINGATKKIGSSVMLMVNDRRLYADSFWFTLFHEAGHVMNGDYGASFENEKGAREAAADKFAADALLPAQDYERFVSNAIFTPASIKEFASGVGRDPGIVLGRLQNDGYVRHNDKRFASLRHRYQIVPEQQMA